MLMTSAMPPAFIRHADTARSRPEARRAAAPMPPLSGQKNRHLPKNERRPARTNGLYLKQLRCDSSLCRYEKTIRPA